MKNSILLPTISIIISSIALIISIVVGITQIYYYIYNIKTNYSVRLRVLKNDYLEISKMIFKKTTDYSFTYIEIGIPVEIFISNLSKKHLVIWSIKFDIIDNYNKSISHQLQNIKLLKNLEYNMKDQKYINELCDNIKIPQEDTNHFYGIINIIYHGNDARELLKIINKLNNKVTLNDIVGFFSDEPIKFSVKINNILNILILNKNIIIGFNSIDNVKRVVTINKIYQVYGDSIIMFSQNRYFTDTGIENIHRISGNQYNKLIEKMNRDKDINFNYDFIH